MQPDGVVMEGTGGGVAPDRVIWPVHATANNHYPSSSWTHR